MSNLSVCVYVCVACLKKVSVCPAKATENEKLNKAKQIQKCVSIYNS